MTLPPPAAETAKSCRKARRRQPTRILLVEDDILIQDVLALTLGKRGWQTEIARTGEEAIQKWKEAEFDLILMDLQMPGMDGLEATRTIRQKEQSRAGRTPVIGLTAHATQETENACRAAGMDNVLIKPFENKVLFQTIANALLSSNCSMEN